MKNTKQSLLLFIFMITLCKWTSAQNVCLDFDGDYDFVSAPAAIGNSDFTIETWFLSSDNSTSTNCIGNFKRLLSFYGGGSTLELGLCGGQLNLYWIDLANNNTGFLNPVSTNFNDNTWHHLALVRNGGNMTLYLDCVPYPLLGTLTSFGFTAFRIGHWPGGPTPGQDWLGQVDDFRIWLKAKTQIEIDNEKNCVLSGSETDLFRYYNFDEGVAGGNNTGSVAVDLSPFGIDGTLNNFALTGNVSNYVNSATPLAYPNLNNASIEIKDYPYQGALLTEICPGDPAHFRMLHNGSTPGPFNNVSVEWWYDDGPGTGGPVMLLSPPFTDFAFGVPQGNINFDCSTSTDGFVDRSFYAISTVTEPSQGAVCQYKSDEYDLRICCAIDPSAVVQLSPSNLLCEFDAATITVDLISPDLFVQTPGLYVDIVWTINGSPAPAYNDLTTFTYAMAPPYGTLPTNYCFEALVTNCNGKSESFQDCIAIDPEPVCGTIDAFPFGSPQNLMLVSTTPHLIYEICPGDDAIMAIDQAFQFCNPQWQYSFTGTPGTWIDLGFSNLVQNTNVLPTSSWTGNSIFYQIECIPLSNPSGCDPCFSNMVEIKLKDPPIPNAIAGVSQLCAGATNTLSVAFPDPMHTYTWYCDGLQVGTGTSFTYTAVQSACYWFETSDGCYIVESPQYCVTVCEVIPQLTCPLPPNDCACLGDPITLSACGSYSTCSNPTPNLQFTWYIDNVLQPGSGCTITHTPPASGATYRVDVVNTATGCVASIEKTIVPCDKNVSNN